MTERVWKLWSDLERTALVISATGFRFVDGTRGCKKSLGKLTV